MTAGLLASDRGSAMEPASAGVLDACDELLALHLAAATRRFGGAALGLLDLPSLGPEPIVPAQVQVAAVLYYCRELDAAGIPGFVEALAERLSRGALMLDLGGAAQRLSMVWRARQQRFGPGERRSLYARLFGEPGDPSGVDGKLGEVAVTLAEIGRRREDQGVSDLGARLATKGSELSRELSEKATGMAGFAAREIVGQIREALSLLRHPDLSRSLGGGAPWTILARRAQDVLGRRVDVQQRVTRATSGLELLRWLASHAGSTPKRRDPIIGAAETWLSTFGAPA